MRLVRLFIVQAVLLGSCAFVAWALLMSPASWPFGFSLDTLAAMAAGIALTAIFMLMVSWPVQFALRSDRSLSTRLLFGVVSGPLGVWLGLLVLSNYPIDWEWYVSRAWTLHAVYAGVGACFALAWHHRPRPSNPFKPKPPRGPA